MIVEIISVGTEILMGNIVNTNAAYLAAKCAGLGLSCYYQSVVGDNEVRLYEAVRTACDRADVVILSGGLGPTQDDLTKETAAKVLGKELEMHEPSREAVIRHMTRRGLPITDNNWKQAMVPHGCIVVENDNGTAPGIIMEENNTHVILLPGPPGELIPMFEKNIVPYLQKLTPDVLYSAMVKLCGVGESIAEDRIRDLIDTQTNPTIATYAKTGEVHLRVTAKAESEKEAEELVKPVVRELKKRFGDAVFTTQEAVTLEESIVTLMKENSLKLGVAESCTGGMLSARLISVPGASDVYKAGFVTYSDSAKHRLINVDKDTLGRFGAVSKETAKAMVKGTLKAAKADYAVAVTGIAGPDGGTKETPVGLVYIACGRKGRITVKKCQFGGDREKIRQSAAANALTILRAEIMKDIAGQSSEK